jgi:hypothetical protein
MPNDSTTPHTGESGDSVHRTITATQRLQLLGLEVLATRASDHLDELNRTIDLMLGEDPDDGRGYEIASGYRSLDEVLRILNIDVVPDAPAEATS